MLKFLVFFMPLGMLALSWFFYGQRSGTAFLTSLIVIILVAIVYVFTGGFGLGVDGPFGLFVTLFITIAMLLFSVAASTLIALLVTPDDPHPPIEKASKIIYEAYEGYQNLPAEEKAKLSEVARKVSKGGLSIIATLLQNRHPNISAAAQKGSDML